jgi:hypothetical protein
MKKSPNYTLRKPRHYWIQAIAHDESILFNRKVFVTAAQAHDKAKGVIITRSDVLRVHLWDGTTEPTNPDISKLVNTYERDPFEEFGKPSCNVSDNKAIVTQKVGTTERAIALVSNSVHCGMGNWHKTREKTRGKKRGNKS